MINKLSIRSKVLLIPAIAAVAFLFYLGINANSALDNAKRLELARDVRFPVLRIADRSLVMLERLKETLSSAAASGDEDMLSAADKIATELRSNFDQLSRLDRNLAETAQDIQGSFNEYYRTAAGVSKAMIAGNADLASLGSQTSLMSSQLKAVDQQLKTLVDAQYKAFVGSIDDANAQASNMVKVGVITGLVTIGVLFGVAIPIVMSIRRNLGQVVASLRNIAQENGDLTVRLSSSSQDEIGDLVHWFNTFVEKLQRVIHNIVDMALPLANLAQNIRSLSDDARQAMEVQRRGAQSAKDAADGMSHVVSGIAANASDASDSAQSAQSDADRGYQVVNTTVTNIRELARHLEETSTVIKRLEDDSNRVSSVVDVIRGIAEQTNLLALNAAIEAARAGEQGRGFAVVADEVRTLASRTQESTQEINTTIAQLQEAARSVVNGMRQATGQADSSVEAANRAGESLTAITDAVRRINHMNGEIAAATDDQQQVASRIADHVNDIYNMTEQSQESSNRLAEVARELAGLATTIETTARQFRV